ncbi:substrate-binding domain-containing protein [Streptomyces sp. SID5785]|uniref:substrate-binding domain-containing protein n=1 Tax=Streptomyces sp. SID5785 TaxID=2690309 RepID=UPI0013619613|nr:substrate-binding domain-containing protein [Streptomyces sp. SID5785]MZD03882.1 substrate-binding domain-containing protein [Streptomyces sp. SID5785]
MREPVDLRRQRILAVVQSRGATRVSDLAAELAVSVVTLRRDVEELARQGRLRRGHGVATPVLPAAGQEPAAAPAGEALPSGGPVAVVVPERHAYLYEALHGARSAFEEAGVRIALHIAPAAPGAEQPLVERALADGARGLLIAPRWRSLATEEADYAWLSRLAVPAVVMERRPRRGGALHAVDTVCTDHWYGVHLAVEHLTGLGHRRIVLAARDDSPTARAIRAAFTEIVTDHPGIDAAEVALSSPGAAPDPASQSAARPVDLPELIAGSGATGALLHGDVDALMLVQSLRDSGVRVPEDCSVIAYDDVVAGLGSTPLTAVSPPKAEVGRAAAELLLRRIARAAAGDGAPDPGRRLELLPSLQVRGSTRAPGTGDAPGTSGAPGVAGVPDAAGACAAQESTAVTQ